MKKLLPESKQIPGVIFAVFTLIFVATFDFTPHIFAVESASPVPKKSPTSHYRYKSEIQGVAHKGVWSIDLDHEFLPHIQFSEDVALYTDDTKIPATLIKHPPQKHTPWLNQRDLSARKRHITAIPFSQYEGEENALLRYNIFGSTWQIFQLFPTLAHSHWKSIQLQFRETNISRAYKLIRFSSKGDTLVTEELKSGIISKFSIDEKLQIPFSSSKSEVILLAINNGASAPLTLNKIVGRYSPLSLVFTADKKHLNKRIYAFLGKRRIEGFPGTAILPKRAPEDTAHAYTGAIVLNESLPQEPKKTATFDFTPFWVGVAALALTLILIMRIYAFSRRAT